MEKQVALNFNYNSDILPDSNLVKLDMQGFMESDWVSDTLKAIWVKNYSKHRKYAEVFKVNDSGEKKATIYVGSSPALKKNYEALKDCGEHFIIVACNRALKFLLEKGIKPDYVFAIEGGEHIAADFDCDTKDLTLVASPFVSHKALMAWKGQVYFHLCGGDETYRKMIKEDYPDASFEPGGGNVLNTALMWGYKHLRCSDSILVGASLCYNGDYYLDGNPKTNEDLTIWGGRYKALDMYGNVVDTTPALTMYKTWLESYAELAYAWGHTLTNSTEDGILGVLPVPIEEDGQQVRFKVDYLKWMNIAPLKMTMNAYKLKFEKENLK